MDVTSHKSYQLPPPPIFSPLNEVAVSRSFLLLTEGSHALQIQHVINNEPTSEKHDLKISQASEDAREPVAL